jgi:hypothetical protein
MDILQLALRDGAWGAHEEILHALC